jgi:hypothetical protein
MPMGLLVLLLFTLLLGLLMCGAIWGMNIALNKLVGDKHRDMQEIIETGQVPGRWRKGVVSRMARLRLDPGRVAELARLEQKAGARYLREIDKLIRYAHTCSLVDGEATRQLLIEKLSAARLDWQTRGSSDIHGELEGADELR